MVLWLGWECFGRRRVMSAWLMESPVRVATTLLWSAEVALCRGLMKVRLGKVKAVLYLRFGVFRL